jgi:hypothetical protein
MPLTLVVSWIILIFPYLCVGNKSKPINNVIMNFAAGDKDLIAVNIIDIGSGEINEFASARIANQHSKFESLLGY